MSMRITIKDTAKERNKTLDALIRRKVRGLIHYAPILKDAVVDIEHDRHHHTGKVASVEVSLHLFCHGNLPIRASETAPDVHGALDLVLGKLKRLLATHVQKDRAVFPKIIRAARGKE